MATQTKTTTKAGGTAETNAPVTVNLTALLSPEPYTFSGREVPPEVEKFVEDGYQAWKADPRSWQTVTLDSAEAVAEVWRLARYYAYHRGPQVTFQRRKVDDPTRLVYRVTDKIRQNRKSAAGEDAE